MPRMRYLVCALCILLAGCGGSSPPPHDPRALVLDYSHALAAGEGGRACNDLTPERRISVVTEGRAFGDSTASSCEALLSKNRVVGEAASRFTIESVEIVGDHATVTLSIRPHAPVKPQMAAV